MTAGAYRTVFTESARAELRALQRPLAIKILEKLTELEKDPFAFGTTALVDAPHIRRVRVTDYRIFYTVNKDILLVTVVRVSHRSKAY